LMVPGLLLAACGLLLLTRITVSSSYPTEILPTQACLQGWDWATCGTDRAVGFGTGIAMVGREGSHNATLFVDMWQCNGQECFWVQNWQGTVVPGHWLSVNTNAPDRKWLRWRLEGAGGDTQVSLAAKY
ncbi:hypothetical protein ABZ372_34500, partial [Streptomyces sp. NPDC005921]